MTRGVRARIHHSALTHNLRRAKEAAPRSRVMAVIKADAYGHGLVPAARSLSAADALAVESVEAARALREAGVGHDIVLLSGFQEAAELEAVVRDRLTPVIHDPWQLDALERRSGADGVKVWIKVDSGMHRLGFEPAAVPGVAARLERIAGLEIAGLLSHLAVADDPHDPATEEQCRALREAASGGSLPLSLANSPGVLAWPETHLDWVRPGMMLYGCSPLAAGAEASLGLRPAMTLEARIIAVKTVPAGGTIGYGRTWRCEMDTRVGVLACGYGDGYPRHAPGGTPVWVHGRRSRILGRVSMDLITIDLTGCEDAGAGDWVELWGAHVSASTLAAAAGTIPYELVTRVTARVPRVYQD